MFIKQLYNYSKLLFLLMILFLTGQLFINYKFGVVVSPFLNYGMFSEVFTVKPQYQVWEVDVNGKRLQARDFSIQQWDKVILPIQYFYSINSSNELYRTEIRRLFNNLHITTDEKKFLQTCNYLQFEQWYRSYLERVTGSSIHSLAIHYHAYQYNGSRLIPTQTDTLLPQLCH